MFGVDEWLAGFGASSPLLFATVVAILLGLRHAADPDHLTAVTTLLADARGARARTAARLGASWGAGHAVTLLLFGTPIVVAARFLPPRLQDLAEAAVGVMICVLAVRLLRRWRQGAFHVHEHDHGAGGHVHVHAHDRATRRPLAAFGIGLLHGIGGSAGVGVLLVASIDSTPLSLLALAVLAAGTALSMALCSTVVGLALSRPVARGAARSVPALGGASLAFGIWYVAAALALAPYPI
jgi:High-affinity nickel-transport protein